ncbi:hypothetical protein A9J41_14715 [Laribacter hongkongensis]|uniref:hypothetical protein n=1 Tax=Laribacter hongkongensis TaxID=168471 RepID=UPI001878020F|nr:hypothetical protein [Laribacter hongkongensis]MBE5529203.1 hypothetical protein [Laribacter hongkongensis]
MMTEKGQLLYGLEWPAGSGRLHFDFEVRLPTLGDNIAAIEEVGEASGLRVSAAITAKCIVRLGAIPAEDISLALLETGLVNSDFDAFDAAILSLKKKRMQSKPTSPASGSLPLPSGGAASANPA